MRRYSHDQQEQLRILVGDDPPPKRPALRHVDAVGGQLATSAAKVIDYAERGDFVHAIQALCALVGQSYTAATIWGIDLGPFWDEGMVAEAEKRDPDFARVLRDQIAAVPAMPAITRNGTAALGG